MDYKATLNLPKTSFPMKGNLPQSEPKLLERWDKSSLYGQILERRKGKPLFVLHDGPPYANGEIHIGHALNKVLKDLIVRHQTMRGKLSHYIPGWDCHGLPIEYALMRELKVTKHQVDVVDFRRKARAYALQYVGIQRDQFKRLGVTGDWEHPYLTLEPGYAASALRVLKALVEKGFVYRARKPVNWCWSCETALAEAEVEYERHTSLSIYVKFPVGDAGARHGDHLVIWTTTPWTLMGNVAVAVHPDFEYAWRQVGPHERWLTLAQLPASAQRDLGASVDSGHIVETVRGEALEGLVYRHPFGFREGKVVLADYVSMEDGTGLVHTAPGFGAEDFATGKKYGLEVLAPVDSQGKFFGLPPEVAEFNGQQVQAANPAVIEKLRQTPLLLKEDRIEHDYPHCWRCRNPIIFRATDQWFLNVEHQGLRKQMLDAAEGQVQWVPPEGKERMAGMLKTRPDWCLSRQRLWGVPIPALVCAQCKGSWLAPEVIDAFARAAESGPDAIDRWFTDDTKRWVPPGFACLDCGAEEFTPGRDILDVWFDSGVSHEGVLRRREHCSYPADLYLEGSDQHRGWFQVSLITSVALNGRAPYRGVLTHGFVVDGEGRKMSKSLGNVIAPQDLVSKMGADVLRLWVASSDYREDVRISPEIMAQVSEVYRKIRNTIRFCLANVSDFHPDGSAAVPEDQMEGIDRWLLVRLGELAAEATQAYDQYAFHRVVKAVHEFCTVELSNFYLDVVKDRLYTRHPKEAGRRSAQTALTRLADTLIRLIAPILPFTAEEAWGCLREGQSVHLQDWPRLDSFPKDPALKKTWERLLELRGQAMKVLEKAREGGQIGDPLEAELEMVVRNKEEKTLLERHQTDLAAACIVSGLRLTEGAGSGPPVEIFARRASGEKCARCWMRLPTVGSSKEHPTLCQRCVDTISLWYTPGLR